ARSDIFSFGAVLYELVTGKRAFAGDTRISTLAAVIRDDPPPVMQVAPGVPRGLDLVVSGCLKKDPARRFQHMSDVRMILERLRDEADSGQTSQAVAGALPQAPRRNRLKPMAAAAAIALVAGLAGFGLASWKTGRGGTPATPLRRLTWDGSSSEPALSPDGHMVAYVSSRTGSRSREIWVRQVSGGAAIRLTDGEAFNGMPQFSADGSKVYFVSTRSPMGVYEVPVLGGDARLVIPGAVSVLPSPDGKWLAYQGAPTAHGGFGDMAPLRIRAVEGGQSRELVPGWAFSHTWVAWSADSRRLVAAGRRADRVAPSGLHIVTLDGKPIEEVIPEQLLREAGFGSLNMGRLVAWLPGDDLIIGARLGDAMNCFRVPLRMTKSSKLLSLTMAAWDNSDARLSNNRLVYSNRTYNHQVWALPADANLGRVTGAMKRVTQEKVEAMFHDLSPDGASLLYSSRNAGVQGIFEMDLKTGKERLVATSDVDVAYSTYSPDGRSVAFGSGGRGWQAFVMPRGGGDIRTLGNSGGRIRGWTQDGRYLLMWRVKEPLQTAALLEVATGKLTDFLTAEGESIQNPRLSPDGKWVAFTAVQGERVRLLVAPFRGATPVPANEWTPVAEDASCPFWSPDGRSLYYAKVQLSNRRNAQLLRQALRPGTGQPVGPAVEFYRLDGYQYGSDIVNTVVAGRDQVYFLLLEAASDVWMMDAGE
ncbi:MAG: hypothetical protein NTY38_22795, partial [Acidobacteria bacterium]|nr:hypothetical protein [Acidobacteriota bacterium]